MTLTPLAIGTLALLNERPMHPYEMYQTLLARRRNRFVKVRPGSLYHTVERLTEAKLVAVTGTRREGNRPERTTYAITDAGKDALRDRVAELLRAPVREYPMFPVALSEAHNLPLRDVTTSLTAYAERLDESIDELRMLIEQVRTDAVPAAYWLAADHALTLRTAERDWIGALLARLTAKDLPWPSTIQ